MKSEQSLAGILKGFQRHHFRYLLIGGHAVAQYGSPLLTKDYDFWISPEEKERVIKFFVKKKFEAPSDESKRKPIITLYSDWQKVDLFFARKLSNLEGKVLDFDHCLERAKVIQDSKEHLTFIVPSLDDLVALKKMRPPTPKDLQDIIFLESLRKRKG